MSDKMKDTAKEIVMNEGTKPAKDEMTDQPENVKADYSATGNYYVLGHIVQFTGLTDWTLRNYISMGILQGEKINGLWHFTPDQVEAFLIHPAVRASILAKKNAIVYDFMMDTKKKENRTCMLLDLPGEDRKSLMEYFEYAISGGDFHDFKFSMDSIDGQTRVILRGEVREVIKLVEGYYSR